MAWITSESGNIDTFGSDLATPKPFPKINRKAPSLDMKQFASGKTSVDENRKRILATEYVYVDGKTLPVSESKMISKKELRFSISQYNDTKHLKDILAFDKSTACFQIRFDYGTKVATLDWIRPNRKGCVANVSPSVYMELVDSLCIGLGMKSCVLVDAAFKPYCGEKLGTGEDMSKTISLSLLTYLRGGKFYYERYGFEPVISGKLMELQVEACPKFVMSGVPEMLIAEADAEHSGSGVPFQEFVTYVKRKFNVIPVAGDTVGIFILRSLEEACKYDKDVRTRFKKYLGVLRDRFFPNSIELFGKTYKN